MAFSRSVFTVLLLCVVCKASVPVYLWGDLAKPNFKSNPLTTTTSPAFSIILSDELEKNTLTVVFVEKTLSIEDFSHRNAEGETSFLYLYKNLKKAVYLPSVENAVLALNMLEDPKEIRLTESGVSEEIPSITGKSIIIYLEDAKDGESRAEMLRRHNDFMEKTVTSLQKEHKSVVAVYTALEGSWITPHSRQRRQAADSNSTDYLLDGLRLYAKTIKLSDGDKIVQLQELSSFSSDINSTALTLNATLNFRDTSIMLNFKGVEGYWFFESVILNPGLENANDLYPAEEIFALIGFSYRCSQNITFGHGNSTQHIFFEDLKVQPVFTSNANESSHFEFGDSFNCIGFFSAPIWSGLFVVFILLSITFYGIMMMMDIRTMDRFDDPKGKTITINAGE